jgi:hypothetical protein
MVSLEFSGALEAARIDETGEAAEANTTSNHIGSRQLLIWALVLSIAYAS